MAMTGELKAQWVLRIFSLENLFFKKTKFEVWNGTQAAHQSNPYAGGPGLITVSVTHDYVVRACINYLELT